MNLEILLLLFLKYTFSANDYNSQFSPFSYFPFEKYDRTNI